MKKILGLDLGTNSIGWALVEQEIENKHGNILGMGSRIIPMSQDIISDFGKGNSISQTAERTGYRGVRRLRERHLLRRERLHRVLNILGLLPGHYASQVDFQQRLGQFKDETEPKIAYSSNNFIFKMSFNEMLEDFRRTQPDLINRKNKQGKDAKTPYDWTIYYLRKKALTQKLEKEELAWILLNFNQKRGYYQLRGEEDEEESPNKLVEFHSLKIISVLADEKPNSKGDLWYTLVLENGWIYRRSSKNDISNWKDNVRNFIVTTDLNEDGSVKTDKEGNEKRSFRAPSEDDWTLLKKKSEQEIDHSNKTVGAYIYDTLLQNPNQKIRGSLVRTIERKYYKQELIAILQKQIELQPELFHDDLYSDCVRELYRNNEAHQQILGKKDFVHLFVEDILFYQRPLKSKKSSISNCTLEYRKYKSEDKEGNPIVKKEYLKAIPKSHPLYQEFRVWQWLFNLKFYKNEDDTEITNELIQGHDGLAQLFDFLMSQKEIDHKSVLKHLLATPQLKGKALTTEISKYRWNYVYDSDKDESKKYPCNETGYEIRRRLAKVSDVPQEFLSPAIEQSLWHIIYSVTDKHEFEKALKSFANKHQLDEESFIENFRKFKPFDSEYGAYSEKAIKKLLPLMRLGKYWSWNHIDPDSKIRIDRILTGEYDAEIKNRVRDKSIHLTEEAHFQGLQLWLAQYIVYDRHSEAALIGKWQSVSDMEKFISDFKQHSLRNPIVEQVITETLRVVKDIWTRYGNGAENYFDEIHIELGRDMKNTADERKKISNRISDNENTNLRIKALIAELNKDSDIQNVRPYSPSQQEALKIYEEYALSSEEKYNPRTNSFESDPISDEILKISKTAEPSNSELQRYKLWLEQRYRSPYTGAMIPLSRLFTEDFEIEHVIPQSRYFDDSLSNKVICESAVNQLKDKQLGMEFIKNHHGEILETGKGKKVKIFTEEDYTDFIKQHYSKNQGKRNKLLLEEVPEKMIERQLNDTRYISKYISNLLSNLVRADKDDEGINSKNILPGNGGITSKLKNEWGLNDVWNELILPRFERMNQLTNTTNFTSNNTHGRIIPTVPLEYSKGFQKKRIDHRHHAMDALVVACTTRDHINYLNNKNAHENSANEKDGYRYDLKNKLCFKTKTDDSGNYKWQFKKPWESFTANAKGELEKIIVSFKQNLRVINKTTNKYESYKDENGKLRIDKAGKPKKGMIPQTKGDSWAIRKSFHTPMPYGKNNYSFQVLDIKDNLGKRKYLDDKELLIKVEEVMDHFDAKIGDAKKWLKLNPIKDKNGNAVNHALFNLPETRFRKRQPIMKLANRGQGGIKKYEDAVKFIHKISDKTIMNDLVQHLHEHNDDIDLAFSAEGIEQFNQKRKIPVYKLPISEASADKFPLGSRLNTKVKFGEADSGTNLFFAVYWSGTQEKRVFETISLKRVISHQKSSTSLPKEQRTNIPENKEKGDLLFSLSPHDLVFAPTQEERMNINEIDFGNLTKDQMERIFIVNDFSSTCYFTPNRLAKNIAPKEVDLSFDSIKNKLTGSYDTKTASFEGFQIKDICVKLQVDRLGNIKLANKPNGPSSTNTNQVQESQTVYSSSKKISVALSPNDSDDSELRFYASLSPEERFRHFLELISRFYTFSKTNWSTKKIILDS